MKKPTQEEMEEALGALFDDLVSISKQLEELSVCVHNLQWQLLEGESNGESE